MRNLNTSDFFFCYTKELSDFLSQNDLYYIFKAKSIKDNSVFTLYEKSDRLQGLLDEYKNQ